MCAVFSLYPVGCVIQVSLETDFKLSISKAEQGFFSATDLNFLFQEYSNNPVCQTRNLESMLFSSPKSQIQKRKKQRKTYLFFFLVVLSSIPRKVSDIQLALDIW